MLIRHPTRPPGRSTRCSSSSRVQFGRIHVAPRAGRLLVAGLVAIGVVRRGQHVVGDVGASTRRRGQRPGSSSTSDCDQIRARGSKIQRDRSRRTSARPPATGPSGHAVEQARRVRRCWRRWSTAPPTTTCRARAGRCDDRERRAGAGWPASASAGRVRSGRGRPGSAPVCGGRIDAHAAGLGSRPRCCQQRKERPCRTPWCHASHVRTADRPPASGRWYLRLRECPSSDALTARYSRCGARAGRTWHRQDPPTDRDRRPHHRRRAPIRNRFCC